MMESKTMIRRKLVALYGWVVGCGAIMTGSVIAVVPKTVIDSAIQAHDSAMSSISQHGLYETIAGAFIVFSCLFLWFMLRSIPKQMREARQDFLESLKEQKQISLEARKEEHERFSAELKMVREMTAERPCPNKQTIEETILQEMKRKHS